MADALADITIQGIARYLQGTEGLDRVPELIIRVIEQDLWRERVVHQTHEIVHFTRFEDFVGTPPLEGLGSSLATLERVCSANKAALDAIDRVTQQKRGGDRQSEKSIVYNIHNALEERPAGTSQARALRRLRAQRPDLHEQVLADMLSPHAAMVQAGFRKRTVSIPIDDPADVARRLRALLTPEQRRNVAALLATEEG